jgi:hypothetical protein
MWHNILALSSQFLMNILVNLVLRCHPLTTLSLKPVSSTKNSCQTSAQSSQPRPDFHFLLCPQGDNLFSLCGVQSFASNAATWMLAAAALMIPTVWLPDLKALSGLGLVGVTATCTVTCAVRSPLRVHACVGRRLKHGRAICQRICRPVSGLGHAVYDKGGLGGEGMLSVL